MRIHCAVGHPMLVTDSHPEIPGFLKEKRPRNFRNEGVSTQHNPEFTMLECRKGEMVGKYRKVYPPYDELDDEPRRSDHRCWGPISARSE